MAASNSARQGSNPCAGANQKIGQARLLHSPPVSSWSSPAVITAGWTNLRDHESRSPLARYNGGRGERGVDRGGKHEATLADPWPVGARTGDHRCVFRKRETAPPWCAPRRAPRACQRCTALVVRAGTHDRGAPRCVDIDLRLHHRRWLWAMASVQLHQPIWGLTASGGFFGSYVHAGIAQRQSRGLPNRRSRVRFPLPAPIQRSTPPSSRGTGRRSFLAHCDLSQWTPPIDL